MTAINLPLFVLDSDEVRKKMDNAGFKSTGDDYAIDEFIMDYLDIDDECPEGHRPVAVHIVPYTVVDGENVYFGFAAPGAVAIYVSFPITQQDFVGKADNPMMSFARTILGKIIRTLDQPHIDISINKDQFYFPAMVAGEPVWAVEVKGDNHHVVDELVAQLGTVLGRITHSGAMDSLEEINELSRRIINYKAEEKVLTGSDLTI